MKEIPEERGRLTVLEFLACLLANSYPEIEAFYSFCIVGLIEASLIKKNGRQILPPVWRSALARNPGTGPFTISPVAELFFFLFETRTGARSRR
jgi:hypothetical protein